MEYQIISANSAAELQLQVGEALKNGWGPLGGVSVYVLDHIVWFVQAVTKGK
jgi:hypothetical protein